MQMHMCVKFHFCQLRFFLAKSSVFETSCIAALEAVPARTKHTSREKHAQVAAENPTACNSTYLPVEHQTVEDIGRYPDS